jgi:hypothetical protein
LRGRLCSASQQRPRRIPRDRSRYFERLTFTLLPAVEVSDGQAVRLKHVDIKSKSTYGSPLEWQSDGAEWIHLVDIDAAFAAVPSPNCSRLCPGRLT